MNTFFKMLPGYFRFLLGHYLLGVFYLFLFRVILFFSHNIDHPIADKSWSLISKAFLIGLQFDTTVMGYILALPMLVLAIASFFTYNNRIVKVVHVYILSLISLAFLIAAADIPYFNYNFSRLTAVIFKWASDFGIVSTMILQEPTYLIYALAFVVLYISYVLWAKKILKSQQKPMAKSKLFGKIGFAILGLFLILFAMRGRVDSPIRINHAFFCNNAFYNQLGLNAPFSLLKSLKQSGDIKIISDEEAVANVKQYLNLNSTEKPNWLAREIEPSDTILEKNIVLVLMESMSAQKMAQFGNKENITPFLDSLASQSLNFTNIYSAGYHTCNGIFSTLYSYPTVLRERPMNALKINHYNSVPEVLQKNNYYTIYFTTHSETFDNVGGFLPANNFNKIVSQKDYDPNKVQNAFGVPDHILFEYALDEINTLAKKDQPFFATIMTVSDHGPYIIPEGIAFKPKTNDMKKMIVEYADWSLKQFMTGAKKTEWFKNTLFVFVADHGMVVGEIVYDPPLSLHHIPLIFYSPDSTLVQPETNHSLGTQMDVLPTTIGMLGFGYTNQTFGVDLYKEKRPYSYFSSDDKLGCIDHEYYYVYRVNGQEGLYKYKEFNPENLISLYPEKAAEMKKYVVSMTQAGK